MNGRLRRFGRPNSGSPLTLGVGLGPQAIGLAGYRFPELGLEGGDAERENAFRVGIGLAR